MRRFFEILSIFDWVSPGIELAHQAKNAPRVICGRGNELNLFVKSKDYPQALAALKSVGIRSNRKPVGWGIVGEYIVVIPYNKLNRASDALNMAGVEYRY